MVLRLIIMPTCCVIKGCGTRYGKTSLNPGVSLHRFPSDSELKNKWVEYVDVQNKQKYTHGRNHRLCRLHFDEDAFIDGDLKFKAVPTVFRTRYETSDDGCCKNKPLLPVHTNCDERVSAEETRFPSDRVVKEKWEQWVQGIQGSTFVATKSNHTLCSRHFKPSDYMRKRLAYQAVPSVLPGSLTEAVEEHSAGGSLGVCSLSINRSPISSRLGTNNASPQVKLVPLPMGLQENTSIQNATPTHTTESSSSPIRKFSQMNDVGNPNEETHTRQTKRLRYLGDFSPSDFECPVQAEKSLKLVDDEIAKTKRKLGTMQLKYVRTMKKIQTLMDMVNLFKEDEHFLDEGTQIKVCSNCRKVNVCR